jgi:hypothetical protein
MVYRGEVLRLAGPELERVRRAVHRRGGQPNRSRVDAAEALLEALWHKAESYMADDGAGGRFSAQHDHLVTELGERIEFHRFLVRWWPVLTPDGVLGWLADRARLADAVGRVLSRQEIDLLAQSWADHREPSVSDVALLDELRVLLGEPRRRRHSEPSRTAGVRDGHPRRPAHYDEYAHVVVDEAQDLSPMQWRVIGRRGRYASWTIVGDPLQSAWPNPEETRAAHDAALRAVRTKRQFVLRTNYRNSAEIFDLAARVLRGQSSADELPVAVRRTGIDPSIVEVSPAGLVAATVRAAAELLGLVAGTVGVIAEQAQRDSVAAAVLAGLAGVDGVDRARVVGSVDAKGLEYDGVVVVEPERMIAEAAMPDAGRRSVYVALTRATQRLTVVTTDGSVLR